MDDFLQSFFDEVAPYIEKEKFSFFKKTVIEIYTIEGTPVITESKKILSLLKKGESFFTIRTELLERNMSIFPIIRVLGTSSRRGHTFMRYCYALERNTESIMIQDDFANSISIEVLVSSFMTDLNDKIEYPDLLAMIEVLPFNYEKTVLPAVSIIRGMSPLGRGFYDYFLANYQLYQEKGKVFLKTNN